MIYVNELIMIPYSKDSNPKNNGTRKRPWVSWGFVKFIQILFALVIFIPIGFLLTSSHNKTWSQETIYIANDTKVLAKVTPACESKVSKEDILQEMEKEEVLFTAEEFASRITSYYNTLVAVLGVMVSFFTIASFFLVNNFFKNEFEKEKLRIIEELDSDTIKKVRILLRDSIEVRNAITSAIRGEIEGDFVRNDYIDRVISSIEEKQKDIELQLTKLQELCPSKLSVVDEGSCECNTSKEDNVWE